MFFYNTVDSHYPLGDFPRMSDNVSGCPQLAYLSSELIEIELLDEESFTSMGTFKVSTG